MRRLVLGLAVAVAAAFPSVGNGDDQQIANYIKSRLQTEQKAGNLKGFSIDMRVDQGTVWFSGYVSSEAQEDMVLSIAQQAGHMGVVQIVDEIEVRSAGMASQPMMSVATPMYESAMSVGYQEPVTSPPTPAARLNGRLVENNGNPNATAGPQGEPMPLPMGYTGDAAMSGMGGAPAMPGYAWPGYASHPNYAAVTYPKQYSASAWPYIGPFYPYPQVPLGWRKVQLEWDDGWWYLDFKER